LALGAGGTVELTQQLKTNYREADISTAELAMLEFAELLTIQPANVVEDDVNRLRAVGWVDEDIVDIVHQTAMYNYMVRVADGLGIELSEGMQNAEVRDADAVDTRTWGRKNHEAVTTAGDD
jgi:uncharacterized peroxidase-related enzyme